jgi:hypothetical protein
MLSNTSKLYFPKLVFDKAASIDLKPTNTYCLDWTRKVSKCNQSQPVELTEEYEDAIKNLRFAISDSYFREIRRCSWRAVEEWNVNRQIDSSLKSIYLLPTASYIETAFKLLTDCLYDESTNYFYRKDDKIVIPYLLLYKFWKHQVSNALLFNFSLLSELITVSMNKKLTENEDTQLNKFLNFVNTDLGTKND